MRWIHTTLFLTCAAHITATYHSHIKQDEFLNQTLFKNKRSGTFVDIGAHDGITINNTLFFEKELGWNGICVEPLPHIFEKLTKNRSCICTNACIAAQPGTVEFFCVESPNVHTEMLSGMVKSYDPRHLRRMKAEIQYFGGKFTIIHVPAINFNHLCTQHNITRIDYLSIDTEGSEWEIISSIDFDSIYITAMSVENNYNDEIMRAYLKAKGFSFHRLQYDDIYINTK